MYTYVSLTLKSAMKGFNKTTETVNMCNTSASAIHLVTMCRRLLMVFVFLIMCLEGIYTFNVDTKNVKVFSGFSPGIYFGYSLAMLRNQQGNWLLVGAPKAYDPYQPQVKTPGVILRCPLDGVSTQCVQVIVDTSGNSQVSGIYYGVNKRFQHDKTDEWLGVALDVAPNNDRIAVCAHRWKDAKFLARSDLLYMHGICYELDATFQRPARIIPILVDYNSLVHTIERYPIWAYGTLGQSVKYAKTGDAIVMGAPGLNDWQGGFAIEDIQGRNYTIMPLAEERRNWMIGYTITTARLIQPLVSHVVAGAPRANLNGSVYIFEMKTDRLVAQPLIGEQLGSYFGSVLCAMDVNGDQLDDIIVGAPNYSTNTTEEGRVYVYLNRGMYNLERQNAILNGSQKGEARFGSAIVNIGDINKDTFNDVAIGAPYENDGVGAVYIYNGYGSGVWPVYSQRILGSDMVPGIRSFGAALTPHSVMQDVLAVGAYESDTAVILRVNPVVSMATTMYVRPERITASGPYLDLVTCFKYTGAAATLPRTLDLTYTMRVDTSLPPGNFRTIVVPDNQPSVTRSVQIQIDEYVCDQTVRIYAPYQDIWRDVELEVRYELDQDAASACTQNCPILERFNGRDPYAFNNHVMRKVIQYDKQCGPDNVCDTGLSLNVGALANDGTFLVSGKDKSLEVQMGLVNGGENAYNVILDVTVSGNLSTVIRPHEMSAESLVDCDILLQETEASPDRSYYRCHIRKPYPLRNQQEVTFQLTFLLDNHRSAREFQVNFTAKTVDQKIVQSSHTLTLPIKSQYGFRMEGLSGPEQVTLDLEKTSKEWTAIEHKYSIKNQGPSPLENSEMLTYVPAIIHRKESLVTNISVWITTYDTDPPIRRRCYETSRDNKIPPSTSAGGYAISVDCSSFPCRKFACGLMLFTKDQSVLVSVNMSVSNEILARLQARDSVRLASRLSIPDVNYGKSLDKEVATMFHKTSNDMERKKLSIPIWLVIVSVVSAFLVLMVIVAILIKVGFFKRTKKEEMRMLMRRSQVGPFSDAKYSAGGGANGNADNVNMVNSPIEDHDYEHPQAHDNPMADDMKNDETPSAKNADFLKELEYSTVHKHKS